MEQDNLKNIVDFHPELEVMEVNFSELIFVDSKMVDEVYDQIETLMLEFLAPMGAQGVEITEKTIAFVQQVNISVLGSVGLVFLIYTLISLIQKIQAA